MNSKKNENQLEVKNPYTGATLNLLEFDSPDSIQKTLDSSTQAFQKWRKSTAWNRSQLLKNIANQLQNQKKEFSELICAEAGKPISLARVEVDRAIAVLDWAAGEAVRFSGELLRLDASSSGKRGFGIHTRFPRGIIFGITPYNFPLNLMVHKVAPAIASGCSILIKPSPFAPLTALKLAKLFEAAEPGLVQVLLTNDENTAKLTQSPAISMISFTGSAKVGWMIRRQAPEKPTTLELGGNAWVIVGEDVKESDFEKIAAKIGKGAFNYAGQSCISVQNVAVMSSAWDLFSSFLKNVTVSTPFGDPGLEPVVSGPQIHELAATKARDYINSLEQAHSIIQSSQLKGQKSNALVAPTLVIPEPNRPWSPSTQALVQEEIFAPVMVAHRYDDVSKIISTINSSRYGLQTGVFTNNWSLIDELYHELNVGGLVVNDVPTTRYDHQPYGGIKESGHGREGIRYAMEEMTESKFLALTNL